MREERWDDLLAVLEIVDTAFGYESKRSLLKITALEKAGRTVELLEALDALGNTATPDQIRQRIEIRAFELGDWVGAHTRLAQLLAGDEHKTLAHQLLRDVIASEGSEINLVQLARFLVLKDGIEYDAVVHTALSSGATSLGIRRFVLTILEFVKLDDEVIKSWLKRMDDEGLRTIYDELVMRLDARQLALVPDRLFALFVERVNHLLDFRDLVFGGWESTSRQ